MSIFPLFPSTRAKTTASEASATLKMMREIARDPKTGRTVWKDGKPVVVSGAEAVTSWAIAALRSCRGTGKCNSRRYGAEFHKLIGAAFTEDIKRAILPNVVRDVLLQCPYITDVEVLQSTLTQSRVTCNIRIKTIYGEVKVYVDDG